MANYIYEMDAAVNSNLEYGFKWNLQAGETIVQSTWTVVTGAVGVTAESVKVGTTSVYLHPTVAGTTVRLINEITTNSTPPRVDSRTLMLSVKRR